MKKNIVCFLQGDLSLGRAIIIGSICFTVWTLFYFVVMVTIHVEWLDAIIIDSFLNKHDGKWFYYELASTTLLFPCYFLILLSIWRSTKNSSRPVFMYLTKVIISLCSVFLALLYMMLVVSIYFFGPPSL